MAELIDLCEDDNNSNKPSTLRGSRSSSNTQGSKPTSAQPNLPTQSETAPQNPERSSTNLFLPNPGPGTSQSQAYSEVFFIDFITAIEHAFPWQTFAIRHRILETDLRHLFFVLVTLPLSDPDDNSKRLKVAQGAQKRFREWRQAWEETVANIGAERSESVDAKASKTPYDHAREEEEIRRPTKKRRLSRNGVCTKVPRAEW